MKHLFGALLLLTLGCTKRQNAVDVIPYYDLSAQLRKQIKTLYDQKAYLIKYVVYNTKPDQVINRKPDWNKEFDALFEVDIHAPSLVGLYSVDTMRANDSTLTITYKAKTEDETVRQLTVNTDRNGDMLNFNALVVTGSMLNRTTRTVKYRRYNDYQIDVNQVNKYSSDDSYSVKGEIHMSDEYFE